MLGQTYNSPFKYKRGGDFDNFQWQIQKVITDLVWLRAK